MRAASKSPEQIEDEIRGTRRDIDRTLSALQGKLSPGQLLDQALGYMKDGGGEFASNLGRSVCGNPIAATLTGIGLTWLMIGNRSERSNGAAAWGEHTAQVRGDRPADFRAHVERGAEEADAAAGRAAETVRGWGGSAREGVHAVRDTPADYAKRAERTTSDISHRAGDYAHSAWEKGTHIKDRAAQALNDYPLAVGLLGLAAGAVAAAVLPSTRHEDELIGETADEVKQAAREAAGEAVHKTVDAAEGVVEETIAETQQQRDDEHLQRTGPGSGGLTFGTDQRAASEEPGSADTTERR